MPSQLCQEREPLREEDVQGLKYFRKLWPLFERLHTVGCQRDKAGNRELFMDQYCSLVLLFMFNHCLRSLRALQQASELKNVQRKLGCGRASLGSLSEATDVFDPERLREIIGELAAEVKPLRRVTGESLDQLLTAVDGSVVKNRRVLHAKCGTPQVRTKWSSKLGHDLRQAAQKLGKRNSNFPQPGAILYDRFNPRPTKLAPPSAFPRQKNLSPSLLRRGCFGAGGRVASYRLASRAGTIVTSANPQPAAHYAPPN